jgi:pimeloyl-ACP methyl ester carboxylesterase
MKTVLRAIALTVALSPAISTAQSADLRRADHTVMVRSSAPAMRGQEARLYVREVAPASGPTRGVVLFVHGAGTPSEVAFDTPLGDFSWMAYLARGGFDVFAVDMVGYGRSTRPAVMGDRCNIPKARHAEFAAAPGCVPSTTGPITTMASDWADIAAVVDHLRALRKVDKVALAGWSQGGVRTFGYALANPDKVSRLVVLAPAFASAMPTSAPDPLPQVDGPMSVQSREDFLANWRRQAPCDAQFEPATAEAVWSELLASDPVGASWTPAVRRAPVVPGWGFNAQTAPNLKTPYLMITGATDGQVPPERVRELYAALGSSEKVLIDLGCSSHNAMWEKNHLLLFKASLDWLTTGKVDGVSRGVVKLGY